MTNNEKARFTFRLPQMLFRKLKDLSEYEGVSMNAVILKILWRYFEEKR